MTTTIFRFRPAAHIYRHEHQRALNVCVYGPWTHCIVINAELGYKFEKIALLDKSNIPGK